MFYVKTSYLNSHFGTEITHYPVFLCNYTTAQRFTWLQTPSKYFLRLILLLIIISKIKKKKTHPAKTHLARQIHVLISQAIVCSTLMWSWIHPKAQQSKENSHWNMCSLPNPAALLHFGGTAFTMITVSPNNQEQSVIKTSMEF